MNEMRLETWNELEFLGSAAREIVVSPSLFPLNEHP